MALLFLKKICDTAKSFPSLISVYENFKFRLAGELQFVKDHNETQYRKLIGKQKDIPSYAIFFGVNADTLFIKTSGFFLRNPDDEKISMYYLISHDTTFVIGQAKEIEYLVKKKETWQKDIVKTLNQLIEIEVKAHPFDVGKPIDIIKVTKKKTVWIQKKKLCN